MTEEERREKILDARAFYLAAPAVLPIITARKRNAVDRLLLAFREGRTDLVALVAEVYSFDALEREFNIKDATFKALEAQQEKK